MDLLSINETVILGARVEKNCTAGSSTISDRTANSHLSDVACFMTGFL